MVEGRAEDIRVEDFQALLNGRAPNIQARYSRSEIFQLNRTYVCTGGEGFA